MNISILHRYLTKNYTKELSCSQSHSERCIPHRQEEEQSPGRSCLLSLAGLVVHPERPYCKVENTGVKFSLSFCCGYALEDEATAVLTNSLW